MFVPDNQLKVDCKAVAAVHCKAPSSMKSPSWEVEFASGSDSYHLLPEARGQMLIFSGYWKRRSDQVMKPAAEQVLQAAKANVDL